MINLYTIKIERQGSLYNSNLWSMFSISVDNLIGLISGNGGIVCLLVGRGNLTNNILSYLTDEFTESKLLVSTTVCESRLITEIVRSATLFFTDANNSPLRKDENGDNTFKAEKPSLIFIKHVNTRMWEEPVIEILTDRRDTVKCIKVFTSSLIETIPIHIRKRTHIWIVTRDCSSGSLFTLFTLILKKYHFDEFMKILDEYRVLIIWRKQREYVLYSLSDVCPEVSMDIEEVLDTVVYKDISKMILDYSYRVM